MPHRTPLPAETAVALVAHDGLVAQLRSALVRATGAPVDRIETHISSLLLCADEVYKLKKPVAFGFVDFSTPQARHDACVQELRLNRRTAPRHYVGVVAVRQGRDGPTLDGAGEPLDWAVHMRRFDDGQRLDRLASQGRLTPAMIDRLAEVVARFHALLPPAPPGYGSARALRHWARENLAELAALVDTAAQRAAVAALQQWSEVRGEALAPVIELRVRTGHVREVHGDLHLANIAWIDDAPLLFDALEFNDTLRHTDTVGDLAFVHMDLRARGLPRLAWRFVSASLEASGDHAALALLAWWSVYRAAVRAKVALLSARQGGADAAVAQADAERYLALAGELAFPRGGRGAGQLLLTCGASGSGKSTVAALLAERIGAICVRSDVERKRLHGLAPTARAAPGLDLYGAEATRRTYLHLQELAELALQAGESLVVDAAFLLRDERERMREIAGRHGAAFHVVWCEAPEAVLAARIEARQRRSTDPSDAGVEVLRMQLRDAQWPGEHEQAGLHRLCSDVPYATLLQRCEAIDFAAPLAAG